MRGASSRCARCSRESTRSPRAATVGGDRRARPHRRRHADRHVRASGRARLQHLRDGPRAGRHRPAEPRLLPADERPALRGRPREVPDLPRRAAADGRRRRRQPRRVRRARARDRDRGQPMGRGRGTAMRSGHTTRADRGPAEARAATSTGRATSTRPTSRVARTASSSASRASSAGSTRPWRTSPLGTWKAYLKTRLLTAYAPYLDARRSSRTASRSSARCCAVRRRTSPLEARRGAGRGVDRRGARQAVR